ncbi:signal peptidase complex subunit spc2 [Yamadazyma tenuis]|uniref:Signal peptidase complex subunit 2 n=1 Tax=Candida tenuis (strain ATCC 10573 / BCRC 21748 / CBS 615 / JCM 9827 / NBRC 10315 / NRRL Y-1498 / VKM Y-70) TaxID=590646 RepID=G3B7A1_CANTC|nr:uncharacterized protein CANTEDRAFT_115063 [Yamadazyma tenuis ATCC 10573]EGV61608.1 hypothetical protein CANTEDRAFT_115063 [Yamadazyma tenuis ATCC 10573]WEJ92827.1 signal peptidase complex subunit spc2 [Yamadazyma tenuis]
MSTTKPNLYNVAQLRTIVDDNLSDILGGLGYSESFKLTDIKLALGVLTVLLSGGLFLIEKKIPFNESFTLTVLILAVYFAISGVLFFLTNSKRFKNIKYVGFNDNNEQITIVTSSPKYEPVYNIELRFGEERQQSVKTHIEFMKIFDNFSMFQPELLKQLLSKEIEKVGKKRN